MNAICMECSLPPFCNHFDLVSILQKQRINKLFKAAVLAESETQIRNTILTGPVMLCARCHTFMTVAPNWARGHILHTVPASLDGVTVEIKGIFSLKPDHGVFQNSPKMDMAKAVKLCKSPIITLHFMAILAMSLRPVRSGVLVRGMRCMPQVHARESHAGIGIR